jgi:flagellar capping protein FliD
MSDFMRDPVKTLEYLVAEVKSKGYTIPFLTEGVNPGMDLTAVQRLIETKMQPFTQAQQQVQQQEEARRSAQQTLDGFLDQHPEANYHLPVLTEMLQASPGMSLQDAYLNLVSWSARQGLDHTQPLAPQIAARQHSAQTQTQNQHQPQSQHQQAPSRQIPNGRSAVNGAASLANAQSFNENSSWSDIIRSAMEDAGSSV